MRSVDWSDAAERDLEAIDDYWSQFSLQSAERILGQIGAASDFLTTMPHAGPALNDIDARKWTVRQTRYLLLYRIYPDRIEILRVHHGSEDWPKDA